MSVYESAFVSWAKADDSPVTEADLRADEIIVGALRCEFGGVPIISEERQDFVAGSSTFFLVDPLDGTKEFVLRNGEFTVNIALIVDSEPEAGVVFAPALNELFWGARELGAWKGDSRGERPISSGNWRSGGPLRVVGSRSHGGDEMERWLSLLAVPYEFAATGSSLKLCRVAEGQAELYPRLGPTMWWDTAAAHSVLREAGGYMHGITGAPFRYAGFARRNPSFVAYRPGVDVVLPSASRTEAYADVSHRRQRTRDS